MSQLKGDNLAFPARFISWRDYRGAFGDTGRPLDTMADVKLTNYELARFERLEAEKALAAALIETEQLRKKLKKIKRIIRGPKFQTEKSPD